MTGNSKPLSPISYYDFLSFPNFRVTWAGPFEDKMCFGSDDGRLIFASSEGKFLTDTHPISDSREAVNGFATFRECQAVSTRSDVTFMSNQFTGGNPSSGKIKAGVHGILATSRGYFVAPMGDNGLMIVKATGKEQEDVYVTHDSEKDTYFYRSITLVSPQGDDVIVSAIRGDGIAAGVLPNDIRSHVVNTITPKDVDVIDVCGLGNSLSVGALGKNGMLMLFRDIFTDKQPLNFKFESIKGVAYRLLSARGHVFILTSKALYMAADLATRVIAKEFKPQLTQILTMPLTAVDANIFHDKNMLVVDVKGRVIRVHLNAIEGDIIREGAIEQNSHSSSIQNGFDSIPNVYSWQDSPRDKALKNITYDWGKRSFDTMLARDAA